MGEIDLPDKAYNPRRRQYRGGPLLDMLCGYRNRETGRVLGLVEGDCYVESLNFVFGLATRGGREALIALPRLRAGIAGRRPDPKTIDNRILKEALHELGHNWGLDHCNNPDCVMRFSLTLAEVDEKSSSFCKQCAVKRESKILERDGNTA
ncbi:MAG: archaemetzincin family Zn-dependent metalloprotease [Chitinivibrionales bacterium]|nr:archaemetzincin family Zn-dependent metalloprotease [Chitinivibrionales bacterium]